MTIAYARRRVIRSLGILSACVLGLALFLTCWQAAAAQAPAGIGVVLYVNNQVADGLVGYWKLDQVTNTATLNSALFSNRAVLSNGAVLTAVLPPLLSIPNFESVDLSAGGTAAVVISDAAALNVLTTTFSVAAWVRRTVTGTADAIYDSGNQSHHWFFGFLNNNKLAFTLDSQSDISSTLVVTDTGWHHVAAVVNGAGPNNLTLYLDAAASSPLTVTLAAAPSGRKLIGNKQALTTPFNGQIDEVRLYNRALSSIEINRLAFGRGCVTDGVSWATAFTDLQCALGTALPVDEIWVAASPEPYRPGSARGASFKLVNGAGVYGGFAGNETSRGQRPPIDFGLMSLQSVLSGDLLGDDVPDFGLNLNDNAFHVLNGTGAGSFTVLDGFVVTEGHANSGVVTDKRGAGIVINSGSPQLAHDMFQGNIASNEGGGAYSAGSLLLTEVVFDRNISGLSGGGAYAGTGAAVTGGSFTDNQSDFAGGGLYAGLSLAITDTQFISNDTKFFGGGAFTPFTATVLGGYFERNSLFGALSSGGGLRGGNVTVTDTQFLSNTALGSGGGLYATDGWQLSDLRVEANSAGAGGGLRLEGFGRLDRAVFLANRAVITDGGALMEHDAGSILDAVFVGNKAAGRGGAMFVDFAGFSAINISAVQNEAVISGSVLFVQNSGAGVRDSLIWDNIGPAFGKLGSGLGVSFSIGDFGGVDAGNLASDPLLVRYPDSGDGNWATLADNDYGDLHLLLESPAIDAGNNSFVQSSLDLDRRPRLVDIPSVANSGLGTPPLVDMGAYEFQLAYLFLPLIQR